MSFTPRNGKNDGEMKTNKFQQAWIVTGAMALGRCAEAQAATSTGPQACTSGFDGHPVLCALVHIVFLSVLLGVGSTIVAVLFKPTSAKQG